MALRIAECHGRDLLLVNQLLCLQCVILSVIRAQMCCCRRLAMILADVNNGFSFDWNPAAALSS